MELPNNLTFIFKMTVPLNPTTPKHRNEKKEYTFFNAVLEAKRPCTLKLLVLLVRVENIKSKVGLKS
jgi:hypothetical protein